MKRKIPITITLISIIIITTGILRPYLQKKHPPLRQNIEIIKLDIDKAIDILDISSMIDTSVQIIPLENSEQSLIGEITDLILKNDTIFIIDNTAKTIFIFDLQGKLLSKICKPGRGPGEYMEITACTVTDTNIIIYDHLSDKVNRYNINGKFLGKIAFKGWGSSLFAIGEKLFFVNDWSNSDEGCYRLFATDLSGKQPEKYLPFPQKQTNRGWVLDRYYAPYKDTVLIINSSCDTIYKVTDQNVSPGYYVDFVKKKLPEQKAIGDGREALRTGRNGDYIQGIQTLDQSENFIFIRYRDKNHSYTSIYNKKNKNIITCHQLALTQNGKINLSKFKIDQNKILSYTSANDFKLLYEYVYSKAEFSNPELKQRIQHLNRSITEDSNPLIFIYKFKTQ